MSHDQSQENTNSVSFSFLILKRLNILADVTVSVTKEDPLLNKNTHYNEQLSLPDDTRSLVAPDPQLLVVNVRNKNTVVFRHHPNINVVSCDDTFGSDVLGRFCEGDDGLKEPHTALSFTFT